MFLIPLVRFRAVPLYYLELLLLRLRILFVIALLLDLEPFGAAYIGLRLLPQWVARVEGVPVFVNDAEDKSEDCLCVRVQYC
eukprot:tig00021036_g17346.t1